MTNSSNNRIEFHFPDKNVQVDNFIDSLILSVNQSSNAPNAGFTSPEDFRDDLEWRFSTASMEKYNPLELKKQEELRSIIEKTLEKSKSKLPLHHLDINILVFPWLPPFDEFDKQMGFVSGFASGSDTINTYLDPGKSSESFLSTTIAHEYNHIVFFHNHPSLDPDLPETEARILDVLIWEGLAENFSEQVVGEKVSPIISNLTEIEAREAFKKMKDKKKLEARISNDADTSYQEIFFGADGEYKRWAGYSVGYFIVRTLLESKENISWEGVMEMNPAEILSKSPFIKK